MLKCYRNNVARFRVIHLLPGLCLYYLRKVRLQIGASDKYFRYIPLRAVARCAEWADSDIAGEEHSPTSLILTTNLNKRNNANVDQWGWFEPRHWHILDMMRNRYIGGEVQSLARPF